MVSVLTHSNRQFNEFNLFFFFPTEQDFAILLANRSAALYHMEKYDHALQDIELAEVNYPVELLHKLKERSARCHLARKNLERALRSFQ